MVKRNVHVGLFVGAVLVFVAACTQGDPTSANACDRFGVGCTADELQAQLESVQDRLTAAQAGAPYENIYNPGLLQCQSQSYTARARVIGPAGGVLSFGPHEITFPAGALSNSVVVSGQLHVSNHVLVELSPHGLQMSAPAVLDLNYSQCSSGGGGLDVAYVNNNLNVISYPDPPSGGTQSGHVRAELWHFSKYAVAY